MGGLQSLASKRSSEQQTSSVGDVENLQGCRHPESTEVSWREGPPRIRIRGLAADGSRAPGTHEQMGTQAEDAKGTPVSGPSGAMTASAEYSRAR